MSPASLPLKDESLDSLSAKDDKKKIVPCKSGVSVRSLALSGEADGGRISGNQHDNSFVSVSSYESSAENEREIPALRGTENYEGLSLESVRTDGKEDTHNFFSSDQAGPSSILSNTSTNSCDSLVLNSAEGVQMPCLRAGSSGSCEETEPSEMFQVTASVFSDGIISGNTSLNTGRFNRAIPQEVHFSDSEDNVTYGGGNNETVVDDMQGSSERNWEHQSTQTQRPLDPPLWQSSSSVSGLARDFLARHSQDRSILQTRYTDDRGLINASEAISERRYFGAIGASSCERLQSAFSDVTSGGFTARAGFSGSSFHNESSYSSSAHNTAEPLQIFTGQSHCPWIRNGMSSDGVNTRNCLLPRNDFANRNHSLTGEQDFSRECDSLLNQNFLIGRLISPNSRFVYGSTSSNFTAGIVPRYLVYGYQSHVLSDGNSALIADQRSHHSNLNRESPSSQFGDREQAEAPFAANGVVLGRLAFIVPPL